MMRLINWAVSRHHAEIRHSNTDHAAAASNSSFGSSETRPAGRLFLLGFGGLFHWEIVVCPKTV